MKTNFIVLLDYCNGEIIKIRLTDEQKKELTRMDDYEEFIKSLEEEYGFRLKNCSWMEVENLIERNY